MSAQTRIVEAAKYVLENVYEAAVRDMADARGLDVKIKYDTMPVDRGSALVVGMLFTPKAPK